MTRGWRWWLAFFLLPDSHRLHWHQLAWRTVIPPFSATDPMKALRKAAGEFEVYIHNNAGMIPNYAERRRYGERVSTGFVESAINTVVGKRFGKRQQMRWSKGGAHLMLQVRTRALDGTLRGKFEQWYPGLKAENRSVKEKQLAA